MPSESWPTGSLRFLLLLVSFLRKKPSGNQSVLCSRLRRAINIPTIKITNKKREATPTSSSLPHSGISSGNCIFVAEKGLVIDHFHAGTMGPMQGSSQPDVSVDTYW